MTCNNFVSIIDISVKTKIEEDFKKQIISHLAYRVDMSYDNNESLGPDSIAWEIRLVIGETYRKRRGW